MADNEYKDPEWKEKDSGLMRIEVMELQRLAHKKALSKGLEIAKGFSQWIEQSDYWMLHGVWFESDKEDSIPTEQLLTLYLQTLDKK